MIELNGIYGETIIAEHGIWVDEKGEVEITVVEGDINACVVLSVLSAIHLRDHLTELIDKINSQ